MHGRGPRGLAGLAYIYSIAKPRGPLFAHARVRKRWKAGDGEKMSEKGD